MKMIEVEAPAKINLSLEITGIRDDGYHLLKSVMQSISLSDNIRITIADGPAAIRLTANQPEIPLDSRNTCYRAAEHWLEKCGNSYSIMIDIEKHIPSEAGLGGGSADAAAVLSGLNDLAGSPLNDEELLAAAVKTGADVPFCLRGGTALCEGIGEIITSLSPMPIRPLLLLKPDFGLSTPAVFRESDSMKQSFLLEHDQILAAIDSGDWRRLGRVSGNVLEAAAMRIRPELTAYLELMKSFDAEMVMMSGSGTCIYAVYENETTREKAAANISRLLDHNEQLIYTSTK
ncbi:MAG: 4-(cytidine 5'-diphospho)-2-C-methyl-D-erythritol kinase [Clostridiaceae bacterium]|nr:4-(cytidine 5'-diphospho)-2-C-methyl-D-erythritol kinase [Clostridiaceae bacterium]